MHLKLKFRILEIYGTQSRFAMAIGRNDNWISRIITGRQIPTEQEKKIIADKLNIKDIGNYFRDIDGSSC